MKPTRLFVVVHEPKKGAREALCFIIQFVMAKNAADAIRNAEAMQDPLFKRPYAYPAEAGLHLSV